MKGQNGGGSTSWEKRENLGARFRIRDTGGRTTDGGTGGATKVSQEKREKDPDVTLETEQTRISSKKEGGGEVKGGRGEKRERSIGKRHGGDLMKKTGRRTQGGRANGSRDKRVGKGGVEG